MRKSQKVTASSVKGKKSAKARTGSAGADGVVCNKPNEQPVWELSVASKLTLSKGACVILRSDEGDIVRMAAKRLFFSQEGTEVTAIYISCGQLMSMVTSPEFIQSIKSLIQSTEAGKKADPNA